MHKEKEEAALDEARGHEQTTVKAIEAAMHARLAAESIRDQLERARAEAAAAHQQSIEAAEAAIQVQEENVAAEAKEVEGAEAAVKAAEARELAEADVAETRDSMTNAAEIVAEAEAEVKSSTTAALIAEREGSNAVTAAEKERVLEADKARAEMTNLKWAQKASEKAEP